MVKRGIYWGLTLPLALLAGACGDGDGGGNTFAATGGSAGTGGSASGGTSGSGGSTGTSSAFDRLRMGTAGALDLLFMVDNSISMLDKSALLAEALPGFFQSLTSQFPELGDIHVGVITSSLGAHGGQVCADASDDDHARLLATVRPDLVSTNNSGFLAWDPLGGGESNLSVFSGQASAMVLAAGDTGCGYEASLEAWYRFLIDSAPPESVVQMNSMSVAVGTDQVVLAQRQAFLRPDSVVAIVMLTDENDCSIRDDSLGWLVGMTTVNGTSFAMPRPTTACATNPNDPCCRSCSSSEPQPPAGCTALVADPECQINGGDLDSALYEDTLNLRCYDQKRRFGFDLLYPTQRYVQALTAPTLLDRNGQLVANPLFSAGQRGPSEVVLAGIIGVPWQDIATEASLTGASLEFKSSQELLDGNHWSVILGDPPSYIPPSDPFMGENPDERVGTNPITGDAITPSSSTTTNAINGKEQTNTDSTDLQFACTFPLSTPRDCAVDPSCDCSPGTEARNRTLCSESGAGPVGNTQYWGKAYPSLRQLTVLKALSDNAVVTSICPKVVVATPDDPSYGYNPAMTALLERIGSSLGARCFPRQLTPGSPGPGQVPCKVFEVQMGLSACSCDAASGRNAPTSEADAALRTSLVAQGACPPGDSACESACLCEIAQADGDALDSCQNEVAASPGGFGFCYVDPALGAGSPEVVAECPATQKRLLRFIGAETPAPNALVFLSCQVSR